MRTSPEVSDRDRFAAAALVVDRLTKWVRARNKARHEAIPEEPAWAHYASSDGGIYSEAPSLFPGPRGKWGR